MPFSGHHWHEDQPSIFCCQCGEARREGDFSQPATCRGSNARARQEPPTIFAWEHRKAS